MKRLRLLLLALVLSLGVCQPAHADPVFTPIAIAITTSLPFISVAVDTFVFYAVQVALYAGTTWALSKVSAAANKASGAERQASVLQVILGEGPREAIVGEVGTAGQLVDTFNYGGIYGTDWEVLTIAIADHRCHGLEGFYIGDNYYAFAGNGVQPGFSNQLEVYWHDGAFDQPADSLLLAASGRWTESDQLRGVAYVVVAYKADDPKSESPTWSTGRPQFLFRVKGAFLYDPRKDSTVAGGSGPHRWTDAATWEWSDNAALARYKYVRGFYAGDQVGNASALMIGRGLSELEAPAERVIAYANLCDEAVALKAGGTEPRYRANGVIRADETFDKIEDLFAAAMAGVLVQREGTLEIEPGASKSVVVSITDADLLAGYAIRIDRFASENDRVNTVTSRYIEPSQTWRETAAPIRRSTADIQGDGGVREQTLSLSFVTSQTQAQRCGEISRRLARKERQASLTLGPRFSALEEGDWIAWQSDRYFAGATVAFRIEAHSEDQGLRTGLILREIAASCYSWSEITDEGVPGQAPIDEAGDFGPLALDSVAIQATTLVGADGSSQPAIRATWSTPVDAAVSDVRLEVRAVGQTQVAATLVGNPNAGELVTTNGVTADAELEARVVPIVPAERGFVPSGWTHVTTTTLVAGGVRTVGGRTVADVLAAADAAAAQGRALVQAANELFFRTMDERAALIKETFFNGEKVKRIVVDETDSFEEDGTSLLRRLQLQGIVVDGGAAFQFSDTTLKASPTETWGQYRTGVSTSLASNAAAIVTEQSVRSSADSAFASSLSTVQTTVAGHTASITTLQTSINGISAQYLLVVDASSHKASIQAYAGPTLSSIIFQADQIGFTNGASNVFPLSISGGKVHASSFVVGEVEAGSIITDSILGGAVTGTGILSTYSGVTFGNSASQVASKTFSTVVSFAPHEVRGSINLGPVGTGRVGVSAEIKRNGSSLGVRSKALDQAFAETLDFDFVDTPGAGSNTYTIELRTTNSGGQATASEITMNITEYRR